MAQVLIVGSISSSCPSLLFSVACLMSAELQIKATGLYRKSVFAVADLYCAIIVMISIAEYYKIYNNIYTKYLKIIVYFQFGRLAIMCK